MGIRGDLKAWHPQALWTPLAGFWLPVGRAHFIELKTEVGVLSDAQQSVCSAVLAAGGRVGVARLAEEDDRLR